MRAGKDHDRVTVAQHEPVDKSLVEPHQLADEFAYQFTHEFAYHHAIDRLRVLGYRHRLNGKWGSDLNAHPDHRFYSESHQSVSYRHLVNVVHERQQLEPKQLEPEQHEYTERHDDAVGLDHGEGLRQVWRHGHRAAPGFHAARRPRGVVFARRAVREPRASAD